MAIIKVKKRDGYYIKIDKKSVEDAKLSLKATGLLVYLIGRPEDWKIKLEHLKKTKKDGIDSFRTALMELRDNNYCHLFEVREKGIIKENIYVAYEVPTPFSKELLDTLKSEITEVPEGCTLTYKPSKNEKTEVKNNRGEMDKSSEEKPSADNPREGKPQVEKPLAENPTLLIKEYTNNRFTNNRVTNKRFTNKETTTRDGEFEKNEKMSSSPFVYNFLKKEIYPQLNNNTIRNIQKNIEGLTEERFHKVYKFTEEYVQSGKGENFNAILYMGLKGEWDFEVKKKESVKNELTSEKKKWLSRYSGITTNKELKAEIEGIISCIPIEELNKSRSRLSQLDIYGFKCYLTSLKSRCRGMSA